MSLSDALKKAEESGLDVVEIAKDAKPPVVKIIDFSNFKYTEEKKEREARKKAKLSEQKEVRFSPFIGEHDLQTRIARVKEFLKEGDTVKISIVFKGRQMAHKEFGPKMLDKIMGILEGIAEKEREERFEGRRFVTVVKAIKKQQKQETKPKEEIKTNEIKTKNKKSS
jgi:translation initiation factor IF-3